jgi:hypothetical protein
MKTFFFVLTLTLGCFLFNQNIYAQAPAGDTEYVIVEYMKVKPGMWDKYMECEKVWKLIHQERVKAGYIKGWELEQVIFPSGTNSEYDFLTITHLKNWKAIDDLNGTWTDEIWAKLTSKLTPEQKKMANDAADYRDLVKREIWTAGDMVFAPGNAKHRYIVENFMKIPDGGWEDWMDMESKFVKPVHKKSVELGTRAGWLMGFMVLPRGGDYSYDASTLDFYDSWEQMGKDEGKSWEAIYPDMTDGQITTLINDTRKIVKTEVRMLVDFAE